MARCLFGGTSEFILSAAVGPTLRPGTVWDSQTGGSQITDLMSMRDQPMTTLADETLSAPNGVVQFQGPDDGTAVVWVECSAPTRIKMFADPAGIYVPAEARFRIPAEPEEEQALSIARYASVELTEGDPVVIEFTHENQSGDPLAVGAFDPGQGVTLSADHKFLTFTAATGGWWFLYWSARLTAVSDAMVSLSPIGSWAGRSFLPVLVKAGSDTRVNVNQGPVFFPVSAGGNALEIAMLDGDATLTNAEVYIWRLDAPYEGEVPA